MRVHTIALGVVATLIAAVAQAAPVCSTADLFAGNPLYEEPMDRASEGQGLLDNPPLGWRSLPTILRARVMLARCLVEARRRSRH